MFSALENPSALIVIDLQKGVLALPLAHPTEPVLRNTRTLLDAFRIRNWPCFIVTVHGAAPGRTELPRPSHPRPDDWAEPEPILNIQPTDLRVHKHVWGAFTHTHLHDQLQQRRIRQLVITGIATSLGVESTARSAFELGYHVSLVRDAMTDLTAEAHEHSCKYIFPRLGETGTTADMIHLLARIKPSD